MKKYICHQCGIDFETYRPNAKFCSIRCKALHNRVDIDFDLIRELYKTEMTQIEVAILLGVGRKVIEKSFTKNNYNGRIAKARPHCRGRNKKAGPVCYSAYHSRVYRVRGKPDHCSVCGENRQTVKYEWANITGDYADINDYESMCRSCHKSYDNIINNINWMQIK